MERALIVDASGLMYRAYYAFKNRSRVAGAETLPASYGFFRILFSLIQQKYEYIIIAWDSPGKSKRVDISPSYKANRPSAPDDLKVQFKETKKIVSEVGLLATEIPLYEADDIIYTYDAYFKRKGNVEVVIASSDKDLKQLISSSTFVLDPGKGELEDRSSFEHFNGFGPALLLDYLSLVGDSADNISGVPGIGKVGAKKLICTYGTIDAIYQNIDDISGSIKSKLIDGKEAAYHSRELVTLMDIETLYADIPSSLSSHSGIGSIKVNEILLGKYNFGSLGKERERIQKLYESSEQLSLFG